MPAAARAADISAVRDVVRGVCHGVHAVHVVAHDVCYVSRALHISCLPCAATVQTLAVSVPSVSSAVVFPTAVAIRAYPSLLSVNRPEKLACPWRVANMGGLLHDLQAIVGAEPEFLHEHAYVSVTGDCVSGVQFMARSHAVRVGVVTVIGPTSVTCSSGACRLKTLTLRPYLAVR